MPVLPDLILQGPLLDPQLHTKLAAWFSEEGILRQKGFSSRVVHTLLRSCKEVTIGIYGRVWKAFILGYQGWGLILTIAHPCLIVFRMGKTKVTHEGSGSNTQGYS